MMQVEAQSIKAELSLYMAVVPGCPAGGGYWANKNVENSKALINKMIRDPGLFINFIFYDSFIRSFIKVCVIRIVHGLF